MTSREHRRRRDAQRAQRLAELERQVRAGTLVIRQARPGELPPPGRRSERAGRRLFAGLFAEQDEP